MIGKPKNTTTDTPGIATLDSSGKVPSEQLPSYVDDVLEYANKSAFPNASKAERGKIYVALDTGFTYRWSGSAWVELSSPIKFGTTAGLHMKAQLDKQIEMTLMLFLMVVKPLDRPKHWTIQLN